VGGVTIDAVDAASAPARAAMATYFDELGRRFPDGFEPGDALAEAAVAFNAPHGAFLLARRDGRVVGCGGVHRLDAATAEVKRMWVDGACRGQGLGRSLLDALEGEARRLGCTRVVLDTHSVLSEAVALYGRAGYTPIERYDDNPYAHHWFAKSL